MLSPVSLPSDLLYRIAVLATNWQAISLALRESRCDDWIGLQLSLSEHGKLLSATDCFDRESYSTDFDVIVGELYACSERPARLLLYFVALLPCIASSLEAVACLISSS